MKEPGSPTEKEIRTLGRGDFFGEKALQESAFSQIFYELKLIKYTYQGRHEDGQRNR